MTMGRNGETSGESDAAIVAAQVERYRKQTDKQNGDTIRAHREEAGLTRAKVAQRLAVETRTLARWELEGAPFEKLARVFQAVRAMRLNMEAVTPGGAVRAMSKISTVDLALELLQRARTMEDRDRQLLDLRHNLEARGLGKLFPPGL